MSEPCEFEFVPRKRAVRDSVAQIGNHTSKSEASIQCETALNAGVMWNSSTDLFEARHQREHKRCTILWIPEQVQDEDFSIKKEKNCAICCSNCKICSLQDHGSHTPLQDKFSSPEMDVVTGLQTRCEPMMDLAPRLETLVQKQKQKSVLIVNI